MSIYQFYDFSLSVSIYTDPDAFTPSDQRDTFFYTSFRDRPISFADWYDFTSIIGKPIPNTELEYRAIVLYGEFGAVDVSMMPQDKLLELFESILDSGGSWEDYLHDYYFRESYQNENFQQFCLWDRVYIDHYCVYYHKQDISPFKAFSVIEQVIYGVPEVALFIDGDWIPLECPDFSRDNILDAIPTDIPNYDRVYDTLLLELPDYVVAD